MMSEPGSRHLRRAMQPTDFDDMRKQLRNLADRASQADLPEIACALEIVEMLLDEARKGSPTNVADRA